MNDVKKAVMTNWRWVMCAMLFFATTVNYMDRQVLSLTFKEFIQPEFHWTDSDYGTITGVFSIAYAIFCLFAGKFIDWMGTKKGYLWAIIIWSCGNARRLRMGNREHRGLGEQGSAVGSDRNDSKHDLDGECMAVPGLPFDPRSW